MTASELEFDAPKLWRFHTTEFYDSKDMISHTVRRKQRSVVIGVVALSFDRAFYAFRQKRPSARVEWAEFAGISVDIVDDPIACEVAKKLEA